MDPSCEKEKDKGSDHGIGTPLKEGKDKESTVEGDGSILNPRKSNDEKLQLYRTKEIKYKNTRTDIQEKEKKPQP